MRRAKQVLVLLLLVGAVVELIRRRHELVSGLRLLAHPSYPYLGAAVALQAASLLALAREQWLFLQRGRARIGTTEMAELTAAHNAITMSVPGGVAWSTAFLFDQLRRRGVDRTLAGWDILVSGAVSSFCLFLILAAGVEWTDRGPAVAAKGPVAALASIPVIVAAVVVVLHRRRGIGLDDVVGWTTRRLRRWERVCHWVDDTAHRLRRYQPSASEWVRAFLLALANWLFDMGCLMLCMRALGQRVPWPGIMVAYALAKVAGMLPITPGGLGVVEAGLTGLLVVYGTAAAPALAVTLLYRLLSFWALLPVGWGYWGYLKLQTRDHDPVPC